MTFYLLYEELLQRKRGIYEHVINLTPRQKLKNFGIDVRPQLLGAVEKGSKIWMRYDYIHLNLGNELIQKKNVKKKEVLFSPASGVILSRWPYAPKLSMAFEVKNLFWGAQTF